MSLTVVKCVLPLPEADAAREAFDKADKQLGDIEREIRSVK